MPGGVAIFGWRNRDGRGGDEGDSERQCQREQATRERGGETERG